MAFNINCIWFVILLLIGFKGNTQGIQFEAGSWQAAKHKADSLDKPIFLDLYTTWCKPCTWMSERVFPDSVVGAYFNEHFVNYKMNAEISLGRILASKYKVKGYPTSLFIKASGNELYRIVGYHKPEEFIQEAQVVVEPGVIPKLELFERKYRSGLRDKAFLTEYVRLKRIKLHQPDDDLFNTWYEELSLIDFLDTTTMITLVRAIPNANTKAYVTALDFYNPRNEDMGFVRDSVLADEIEINMNQALFNSINQSIEQSDSVLFKRTMKYYRSLYKKENEQLDSVYDHTVLQYRMKYFFHAKNADMFAKLAKEYARKELVNFGISSLKLDPKTGDTIVVPGYNFQFELTDTNKLIKSQELHDLAGKYYELMTGKSSLALAWVEAAIYLNNDLSFYSLYARLLDKNHKHKQALSVLRKSMNIAKRNQQSLKELSETMNEILQKKAEQDKKDQ